jgi:hypothetical protein
MSGRWCSSQWGGRNGERGKYYHWSVALIGGGEREGLGGSLKSAADAGVEPDSVTSGACWSPLLLVADGWAAVSVFKTGASLVRLTGPLFGTQPDIKRFFYNFQNEPSCKLEKKPPLCCSKNYHIFDANRIKDMEQLYFSNQVQIRK